MDISDLLADVGFHDVVIARIDSALSWALDVSFPGNMSRWAVLGESQRDLHIVFLSASNEHTRREHIRPPLSDFSRKSTSAVHVVLRYYSALLLSCVGQAQRLLLITGGKSVHVWKTAAETRRAATYSEEKKQHKHEQRNTTNTKTKNRNTRTNTKQTKHETLTTEHEQRKTKHGQRQNETTNNGTLETKQKTKNDPEEKRYLYMLGHLEDMRFFWKTR